MIRIAVFFILATVAACTSLTQEKRTATIPNIPVEKKDCNTPLGVIPDGGSAQGYLNEFEPVGKSCQTGELVCHDGMWTGEYVHSKCAPGASAP